MKLLHKLEKHIIKYIIAILFGSKPVHNKEHARPEMHYDFDHEDKEKDI